MNHWPIKSKVLMLALLPAALVAFCLGAYLVISHNQQSEAILKDRGETATTQLALQTVFALQQQNPGLVQQLANIALEEQSVRAVSLFDHRGRTIAHAGPQLSAVNNERVPLYQTQPVVLESQHGMRFIQPIYPAVLAGGNAVFDNDAGAAAPLGWVDMEFTLAPLTVRKYQTIIAGLFFSLLAYLVVGMIANRVLDGFVEPLTRFDDMANQLASGNLDFRLAPEHCRDLEPLAKTFNTMAEELQKAQRELQHSIDQSMADLQETLETIEIQNIELDLARKEALEASRIKSEFLANTSHEIRTPLNGIIGFTNLLLKGELDKQQREYLQTIKRSSEGLLTIINDILDFSKIEAGKLELEFVPLNLRTIVEETLQILAPGAYQKKLELVPIIDTQLPLELVGDPMRIKQVLTNLVSNAIKFSKEGNIVLRAKADKIEQQQVLVRLSVSDSGIGLSQDQQHQLFHPFSQADNSSRREFGGTGLGLAISKRLVEQMGGEIGVDSELGKGATFWFTLRLTVDAEQARPPQQPLTGHVLLFDQNPIARLYVHQLLEHEGLSVTEVDNLVDLLPTLQQQRPEHAFDLVLLDMRSLQDTVEFEGLPALLNQVAHFHFKPVVMLPPSDRQAQRLLNQLALPVLSKPVGRPALLHLVHQVLGSDDQQTTEAAAPPQSLNAANRPTILVVDDNDANRRLVATLLRDLGAEVLTADNGVNAIAQYQEHNVALIFMDIQMPGMDGIETTKRIRALERGGAPTPIIALTAHAMSEQKQQLILSGMNDYLAKPVNEEQLARMINRWLHQANPLPAPAVAAPASGQQSPEQRVVDIGMSLQLAKHKPDLARDMLQMLLDSLEDEDRAIASQWQAGDYAGLQATVHRVHGAACYCGVPRLKAAAAVADGQLQQQQYQGLDDKISQLRDEMRALLDWHEEHDLAVLFETADPQADNTTNATT